MGQFIPTGMRNKITDETAIVINTCSDNDTSEIGTATRWSWSNPTNRAITHQYEDIEAVSVECLWQGTKMLAGMVRPNESTLRGNWRAGKAKRPVGAWAGLNIPLITTPGEARRRIYLPAFRNLIQHQMETNTQVREWVEAAKRHPGKVYLRDFDTGQGIDRNGPMSHAWVLANILNETEDNLK